MYYEIDRKQQVATKPQTKAKELPSAAVLAERISWLGRATLGAFPVAIALDSLLIFGMGF